MKELLAIVIKNVKNSYFADKNSEALDRVIKCLESYKNHDKREVLDILSKRPFDNSNLVEWNLFAEAWRTIERTIVYPFKGGDEVKFKGRTRIIKSIQLDKRAAELENGDLIPLVLIKNEINKIPITTPTFIQLELF